MELTNVRLVFFPPNCTFVLQPLDRGIIRSFKCAYRERLIPCLLLNLRHKRPTEVNLCVAFEMVAAAWVATSPSLIENCFKHTGFSTTVQASCTDCASASPDEDLDEGTLDGESGGGAVPLSLTNAWGELRAIDIPDKLTVDAFVHADDYVVVYEEVTNKAIIESVHEADDTEDQEEAHAEKPNPWVVLDVLDNLCSFFGTHDDDVAMDHFFQCEGRALKLLHGKSRHNDPARVLTHEVTGVPNSVLKMLAELFSDSTTAELFYLNDVAVLVDIVARQLSDLPPGDKRRLLYLSLVEHLLGSTQYEGHRQAELRRCFEGALTHDESSAEEKEIVRRIQMNWPQWFRTD
ncbi:hypothetical protein HPB51_008207 [Rhipicephalus microplus]|uniref:Uncharacterized protein n=1 Tax=Rhipicephalus microplus TaxID=6941 RepID=A0A9J6D8S6_RHIMP|nr:hypothetical protein HPB51_008207 [Rhipicephalus microplus]